MRAQNIYYKYIHILLYVIACAFVILFSFFIFSPSVYADHIPNPCVQGDSLGDRGSPAGTGGPVVGVVGVMGGIHVPVKDFEAEAQLRSIAQNIRIIALNSIAIERDTNLIEKDTQAIRFYLRLLCNKEYDLDHTLQHDWMEVMGKFIIRTANWINTAYNGNPIFVSNPHVYYRNVDLGVTEAMRLDIRDSQIDGDLKLILMRKLDYFDVDLLFPDLIIESFTGNNKDIFYSDNKFTWEAWIEGTMHTENNLYALSKLVEQEVEARRLQARAVEQEKLSWGRGFFPWEVCGQKVFSKRPEDIRTCKTLTPGALIQDLSSLVLGTAVRQIENSDEYEEWISGNAFMALTFSLNNTGLRNLKTTTNVGPTRPSIILGNIDAFEAQSDDRLNRSLKAGEVPKEKMLIYYNDQPLADPVIIGI